MISRILALMVAASLVIGPGGAVFAQGQDEPPAPSIEAAMEQLLPSPSEPATQDSKLLPSAKVVRKGPRSSGAVALTFDDGYDIGACRSIADTLRRNDAVGTFFINGQWLKRKPEQWRNVLDGMEVGNHTRSHPYLTEEPHPVVINQIRSNEWIHEQTLGRPMLKVLRPPYGAYGDRILRIAKQLGYDQVVLWNVDTGDWKPNARPKRIVRAATGAPSGSIILMHCGPKATAKALPKIVRHYQRRGIEVAGLSKVLKGAKGAHRKVGSEGYSQ